MTTPKQQSKSGAKPRRRKRPSANGRSNGQPATAGDGVVKISAEDRKTIEIRKLKLFDIERRLGQVRATFLKNEAALVEEQKKIESEYQSLVRTVAEKLGLNERANTSWTFDADKMNFVTRQTTR